MSEEKRAVSGEQGIMKELRNKERVKPDDFGIQSTRQAV
jgi:hypothetical protein